jgi:hypothetical protein
MGVRQVFMTVALALIATTCLVAQTPAKPTPQPTTAPSGSTATGDQGTLTIEQLYLSQEVEIQLLRTQAFSNTREGKALALQDIKSGIEAGKYSSDSKEVMVILDALAGEGVYRTVRTNGELSNDFPDIRKDSVALLGLIGGKAARDILIKVLHSDKEPMVQAEAIYALGNAKDASKDNLPYMAEILHNNSALSTPDQNLAYAALLAVEKIAVKEKGIADPDIINAVLDVIYGRYQRNVVLKALDVLKKMHNQA